MWAVPYSWSTWKKCTVNHGSSHLGFQQHKERGSLTQTQTQTWSFPPSLLQSGWRQPAKPLLWTEVPWGQQRWHSGDPWEEKAVLDFPKQDSSSWWHGRRWILLRKELGPPGCHCPRHWPEDGDSCPLRPVSDLLLPWCEDPGEQAGTASQQAQTHTF